jgi:surfeit locus 1 family protein
MTKEHMPPAETQPTLGQFVRRPRWIAALVLALIVAAGFAALGQWQLGSAIQQQAINAEQSELPIKLSDLTDPGLPVNEFAASQVVAVQGRWIAEDFSVVSNRVNQGELGYWVVGHVVTSATPSANLVVALGWAAEEQTAQRVAEELSSLQGEDLGPVEFLGRYTPTEKAQIPDAKEPVDAVSALSIAQQANLWQPYEGGVYGGFVVSHETPEGLDRIDSVPPLPQDTINWLNLFYAVEWIVFAGFALYFWYRVAKDAWKKELDAAEEAAESANKGGLAPENLERSGQ